MKGHSIIGSVCFLVAWQGCSNSGNPNDTSTFVNSADFPDAYAFPSHEGRYPFTTFKQTNLDDVNGFKSNVTVRIEFKKPLEANVYVYAAIGFQAPYEFFCTAAPYELNAARTQILFANQGSSECMRYEISQVNKLVINSRRMTFPVKFDWEPETRAIATKDFGVLLGWEKE
jgi:hypothetical protein